MLRVAGIVIVADAAVENGSVRLLATGQTFRVGAQASPWLPPARYRLRVADWNDPRRVSLVPEDAFQQHIPSPLRSVYTRSFLLRP